MSFNPSYSMTVKEKLSEKTAKGIGLHGVSKGKVTDKCCSLAFFYGVMLLSKKLDKDERKKLEAILREDPRPSYKSEDEREYGMKFSGREIKFKYENSKLIVTNID